MIHTSLTTCHFYLKKLRRKPVHAMSQTSDSTSDSTNFRFQRLNPHVVKNSRLFEVWTWLTKVERSRLLTSMTRIKINLNHKLDKEQNVEDNSFQHHQKIVMSIKFKKYWLLRRSYDMDLLIHYMDGNHLALFCEMDERMCVMFSSIMSVIVIVVNRCHRYPHPWA